MIATQIDFEEKATPTPRRRALERPSGQRVLPPRGLYASAKRPLEFAAALVLLVLSAPFLFLAALLVKLSSRGPAIYSQTRLGLNGRPYTIYKLRSMAHDCERATGARWSTKGDARITGVGRFIRKTHLDELPQLWNVLKGEMSLVGPRPERPEFIPALERAIPGYRDRLLVRPGVTGLAQVQLPADSDLDSVRRKIAYDLYYVRTLSMLQDVRIVLCTGFKMVGLSFKAARILFRFPHEDLIERSYETVQAEQGSRPPESRPVERPVLVAVHS